MILHKSTSIPHKKSDSYDTECKYCGVKPFPPGPHHSPSCPRYERYIRTNSPEARKYPCKHCGAIPFLSGPHHERDCPRYKPWMNRPFRGYSRHEPRKRRSRGFDFGEKTFDFGEKSFPM